MIWGYAVGASITGVLTLLGAWLAARWTASREDVKSWQDARQWEREQRAMFRKDLAESTAELIELVWDQWALELTITRPEKYEASKVLAHTTKVRAKIEQILLISESEATSNALGELMGVSNTNNLQLTKWRDDAATLSDPMAQIQGVITTASHNIGWVLGKVRDAVRDELASLPPVTEREPLPSVWGSVRRFATRNVSR